MNQYGESSGLGLGFKYLEKYGQHKQRNASKKSNRWSMMIAKSIMIIVIMIDEYTHQTKSQSIGRSVNRSVSQLTFDCCVCVCPSFLWYFSFVSSDVTYSLFMTMFIAWSSWLMWMKQMNKHIKNHIYIYIYTSMAKTHVFVSNYSIGTYMHFSRTSPSPLPFSDLFWPLFFANARWSPILSLSMVIMRSSPSLSPFHICPTCVFAWCVSECVRTVLSGW